MRRGIYTRKGLTLVELLTVTVIMLLTIGGAVAIYIMALTTWGEGGVQTTLQRGGNIAMEKMVRGIDGRNGIRESNNVTVPNNTTIQYTSGVDGKTRSFYLSDSEIMYDPDTSTASDEFSITPNVSGLTFTHADSGNGEIVTIDLDMQGQVIDNTINVNLATQVKLRN